MIWENRFLQPHQIYDIESLCSSCKRQHHSFLILDISASTLPKRERIVTCSQITGYSIGRNLTLLKGVSPAPFCP